MYDMILFMTTILTKFIYNRKMSKARFRHKHNHLETILTKKDFFVCTSFFMTTWQVDDTDS